MPLGAMPRGTRVLPTRETADTRVLARSMTATTVQDVDESDADAQLDAQPDAQSDPDAQPDVEPDAQPASRGHHQPSQHMRQ